VRNWYVVPAAKPKTVWETLVGPFFPDTEPPEVEKKNPPVPNWKLQAVAWPLGITVPFSVAPKAETFVTAPDTTPGSAWPVVLNMRSAPLVVPNAFCASSL
jgi:hypothetical protein